MKCPYRDFAECIVENCPSCVFEEEKHEVVEGIYPHYMSEATAIKEGVAWNSTRTTYKFISCKLIDNSVQPIPSTKQVINNTTKTSVMVRKSVF